MLRAGIHKVTRSLFAMCDVHLEYDIGSGAVTSITQRNSQLHMHMRPGNKQTGFMFFNNRARPWCPLPRSVSYIAHSGGAQHARCTMQDAPASPHLHMQQPHTCHLLNKLKLTFQFECAIQMRITALTQAPINTASSPGTEQPPFSQCPVVVLLHDKTACRYMPAIRHTHAHWG
jgi:hypothetical protein